ncbi:hypothetical protein K402DRAFT_189900 [Aulographum hederae CBS 113979]|uniref:Fungal N-terminal domain-containing protein n=1 Tax=Aulographum hederae CBS 113979 TaxID=1176131 RepID=A0A6G1GPN2_9PEZI|nr:hypothetical protein K402DRAFT_189900 [Aulographum hederae CBS 113979]
MSVCKAGRDGALLLLLSSLLPGLHDFQCFFVFLLRFEHHRIVRSWSNLSADPMDPVSILGLVIQTSDSVDKLLTLFRNIKDGPKLLGRLTQELEEMKDVLHKFKSDNSLRYTEITTRRILERAFSKFKDNFKALSKTLSKHGLCPEATRSSRVLKRVVTGLKKESLEAKLIETREARQNLANALQLAQNDALMQIMADQHIQFDVVSRIADQVCVARTEIPIAINDSTTVTDTVPVLPLAMIQKFESKSPEPPLSGHNFRGELASGTWEELLQESFIGSNPVDGYPSVEHFFRTKMCPRKKFQGKRYSLSYYIGECAALPLETMAQRESWAMSTPLGKVALLTTTREMERSSRDQSAVAVSWIHRSVRINPQTWLVKRQFQADWGPLYKSIRVTNVLPCEAPIFEACRTLDLVTIRHLFHSGQASPSDCDAQGRSLLRYVLYPHTDVTEENLEITKYLIQSGADLSDSIDAVADLRASMRWEADLELSLEDLVQESELRLRNCETLQDISQLVLDFWMEDSTKPTHEDLERFAKYSMEDIGRASLLTSKPGSMGHEPQRRLLDEIIRLCIESAMDDPFSSPASRRRLWRASGVGDHVMPLGLYPFQQQKWPFLDDLVFDNPDLFFKDILDIPCCAVDFDCMFERQLDTKYAVLRLVCTGGLKGKVFDAARKGLVKTDVVCPKSSSHLLAMQLRSTSYSCCQRQRRQTVHAHLERMLQILLESGESPALECDCSLHGCDCSHHSLTSLSADRGLLQVWMNALEKAGIRVGPLLDEWAYTGISKLFHTVGEVQEFSEDEPYHGCSNDCTYSYSLKEEPTDNGGVMTKAVTAILSAISCVV